MSYRRGHVKRKIKPKNSLLKMPVFWYSALFLVLIVAVFYFLLFFDKFQIKNIIISGNQKIQSGQIENIVLQETNKKLIGFLNFDITSKSIFLASLKNIEAQVLEDFPEADSLKINKNFPDSIAVQIKERQPVFVYCSLNNDGCFYIDESGIIFERVKDLPENMTIITQLTNSAQSYKGQKAVEERIIEAILKIKKDLVDKFQIDVKEAVILSSERLDIKTGENWQVYLNLSENADVDLQITKLNLLLADQINLDERKNLQYIDLRFDRAYYK